MKKKGYIQDLAFFGVFMIIFIIAILVGGRIMESYNEKYQALNTSSTGVGQAMMEDQNTRYSSYFDFIFISVLVFFIISLIISFSLIDAHPAMFFIVFILFIFIIIVMGILGNVYDSFTDDSTMIDATAYPITNLVMDNWVLFSVVLGMVAIGVLFSKLRGGT